MSFGLNGNNLPGCSEYAEALSIFNDIKPLRGALPEDPRPLGHRKSSNSKKVRMSAKGEVIFTYHYTDVVTWCPDGTCVLEPHPSKSTVTFANAFLPLTVYVGRECEELEILHWKDTESRVYALSGSLVYIKPSPDGGRELYTVCGEGQPMGTKPIRWRTVNRKEANALYREHHLHDFEDFLSAYRAVTPPQAGTGATPIDTALKALKAGDRAKWASIASGTRKPVDKIITNLRAAIREEHDAFDYHETQYVTSSGALRRAKKSMECSHQSVF